MNIHQIMRYLVSLLFIIVPINTMAQKNGKQDDLWGPITVKTWQKAPYISGRAATEKDVKEGRAVFYSEGGNPPASLQIPFFATLKDSETAKTEVIFVIQAELNPKGDTIIGYRYLRGGNGVCLQKEISKPIPAQQAFGH